MKRIILIVSVVSICAGVANAQSDITWQTPVTISGTSDVSTVGIYFGSWAPYDGSANSYPVNGVTFQGFSDLPSFSEGATWDNGYNGFASPGTPDSNYNTLLQYAAFSNEGSTPAILSWSGMTVGDTYEVQFWVNDARGIGGVRQESITGGGNTSAELSFGSNSDGSGPGQYIIGTFIAGSSSETLTINPNLSGFSPDPQANLLQVRDITSAVPEPSIVALLVLGAGTLFPVLRRRNLAV
jgi:hypothetical protein